MPDTPDALPATKPGSTSTLKELVSSAIAALAKDSYPTVQCLYVSDSIYASVMQEFPSLPPQLFQRTSPLPYPTRPLVGYSKQASTRTKRKPTSSGGPLLLGVSCSHIIVDEYLPTTKPELWMGETPSTSTLAYQRIPFSTGEKTSTLLVESSFARTFSAPLESLERAIKESVLSAHASRSTKQWSWEGTLRSSCGSTQTRQASRELSVCRSPFGGILREYALYGQVVTLNSIPILRSRSTLPNDYCVP